MKEFSSFTFDKLSYFYNKLLGKFALKSHKHTKSEITDFPTIPTKTSQLTNDSGFKTTDTNTKYTLSKSGSTIKLTGTDGSEQSVTDSNTTYGNMKGATTSAAGGAGLVPAPSAGASTRYLRSDGTWAVPPDTNTTYSAATSSAQGLMSANDKAKLDGIASGATKVSVDSSLSSSSTNPVQNKVVNTALNGKATRSIYSGNLSTNWSGTGPYTQTITVTGIKSTDTPHIAPSLSSDTDTAISELESWNMIGKAIASDNSIKFTCFEDMPTIAISLKIEAIR